MKKRSLLLVALSTLSLLITGCVSKKKDSLLKTEIPVQLEASLSSEKSYYDLSFQYDDNYFLEDANKYNKNLSLLSFGCSIVSKNVQTGNAFFDKASFTDIDAKNYQQSSKDNCAYMLAHKNIHDFEVMAVAFTDEIPQNKIVVAKLSAADGEPESVICKRLVRHGGLLMLNSDNPGGRSWVIPPERLEWIGMVVRKISEL